MLTKFKHLGPHAYIFNAMKVMVGSLVFGLRPIVWMREIGPEEKVPSVGGFLWDTSLYLVKFWKKLRKTQQAKSTSTFGD